MPKLVRLAALLMAVVVGAGAYAVVGSDSASAAASGRYACGNRCDGRSPGYVIPGNGIKCSRSAKLVHSGYLVDNYGNAKRSDKNITVKVYYSTVCQTLWATVTNHGPHPAPYSRGDGLVELSKIHSNYFHDTKFPKIGHQATTKMVNDHAAHYGKAVAVFVSEAVKDGRGDYANFDFSY